MEPGCGSQHPEVLEPGWCWLEMGCRLGVIVGQIGRLGIFVAIKILGRYIERRSKKLTLLARLSVSAQDTLPELQVGASSSKPSFMSTSRKPNHSLSDRHS